MLGSAAQNVIVLSDNVFLYHYDYVDFAASGLIGVFYLIIASIGYGFSRGGQIIIARRHGERNFEGAGMNFRALFFFEFLLSIIIFLYLHYGSASFFQYFIKNPEIYEKCIDYIGPRSWGIFFSYLGVSIIAFYTGIARTKFIMIDTVVLIVVNVLLNYVLVFGKFGFEPMGIKGAAIASTIAEAVAFVVFVVYMYFDKEIRKYKLLSFNLFKKDTFYNMFSVSLPIVFQSILGIGSWFIFFTFIENVGSRELEISNMMRTIYLILSIPCWGFSAGINTLVSNFIGYKKRQAVMPLIYKTININLLITFLISLPVILFPEYILYPLFGKSDMTLIQVTKPYLPILFLILGVFSVGGIMINGLIGTGHTKTALFIQTIFTAGYIIYSYLVMKQNYYGLNWAWAAEIFYWGGIAIMSWYYMRSKKWYVHKF